MRLSVRCSARKKADFPGPGPRVPRPRTTQPHASRQGAGTGGRGPYPGPFAIRPGRVDRPGNSARRSTAVPFGCTPDLPCPAYSSRPRLVLFVGRLSLRKGVPRLLAVWKRLGAYRTHTLRLIGKRMLSPRFMADYAGTFEHIPPIAPSQLGEHYAAARMFVFPSVCEGFALVQTEALAHGTPVIASSNTGAAGFLQSGVHGLIYPHGDDDQLATHLDWMLSRPREAAEMSRAAYERTESWTWAHYRAAIRDLVVSLITKGELPCPDKVIPGSSSPLPP